jgi:hypothetical protein
VWRQVAPRFSETLGLPRQSPFTAPDRRYDRASDSERLPAALAAGESVYFPQAHQVLPRVARLMVALRATFLGPGREECSFLFLAEGQGREALGLHHDGEVDAFWLQLEGRRFVTIGPAVPRGTPEDLPPPAGDWSGPLPRGWWRGTLEPGTLFHLPPRTPHRVIYRGRSLALSLTWKRRAPGARPDPAALVEWDVVRAAPTAPRPGAIGLTQVRAVGPLRSGANSRCTFPAASCVSASQHGAMSGRDARVAGVAEGARRGALASLITHGLLAPRDLPLRIVPADPRALDGWRFD